jgi:hypothetical protein
MLVIMPYAEIATTFLALIVILLCLCWVSLRGVENKLDSLFYTIQGFMRYYEQLNDVAEKERLQMEGKTEKPFTEWHPKDSKVPN